MKFTQILESLNESKFITVDKQKYVIVGETPNKEAVKLIPVYWNSDDKEWDVSLTGKSEHEPLKNYSQSELLTDFDKFSKTMTLGKDNPKYKK